jgi:hydroxypyruvate reductase
MNAETLCRIYLAAVAACHPRGRIPAALTSFPDHPVHLIALGKAADTMALAALETLGKRIIGGVVVGKYPARLPAPLHYYRGGHPVPNLHSEAAGRQVLAYLQELDEQASVLVLLSGGASSLVEVPRPGVGLDEIIQLNRSLMKLGLPIEEMNRRRARLSALKGGGLNQWLPVTTRTLVLSDVVDSPPEVIGSGPTAGRPMQVVADSATLLEAALQAAHELGLRGQVYHRALRGEARQVGLELARWKQAGLWLAVGETTVNVTGCGRGGRCQEIALAFALEAEGQGPRLLLSAGSDGEDGSDQAGAWADAETVGRARALGLEAAESLRANDSYTFFAQVDQHIHTGRSGTNVNDLVLLYVPQ